MDKGASTDPQDTNQLYAIGRSEDAVRRFKLILRSGTAYSISYALLPIYELDGDKLSIFSYGLNITIAGRNLAVIEDYLSQETLLWMKESPSGKDDGVSPVFISNITALFKDIKGGDDDDAS